MTLSYTSRIFRPLLSLRTTPSDPTLNPQVFEQVETPSFSHLSEGDLPKTYVPSALGIVVERNRVYIHLDSKTPFEEVVRELKYSLAHLSTRLDGLSASLVLYERVPSRIEVRRLFGAFRDSGRLHLTEVLCSEAALCRFAAQEHKLRFLIVDAQTKAEPLPPRAPAQPFLTHRTLRSGSLLKTESDTVLYGDVHHGAVIESLGNVTILGRLLGAVYVPEDKFVLATDFRPLQLRFGTHVFTAASFEETPSLGQVPMIARFNDSLSVRLYQPQHSRAQS